MNKQIIRLTESDLHRIVKEAVNKIMSEGKFDTKWSTKDGEAPNGNFIHDMPRNMPRRTPNSPRFKKRTESIKNDNTMISEEGEAGGGAAMGDGSGMGEPASPEDVGATSSLRNKTYDAPAGKKNSFYADADNHTDMIRKSFEGEGRVGHKG